MATFTLRLFPDPVLHKKCEEVSLFSDDLVLLSEAMLSVMRAYSGVGLAANQLGILRRVIVMAKELANSETDHVFVNPRIVESEGVCDLEEGCLSLPGIRYKVSGRHGRVLLNFTDLSGSSRAEWFTGLAALCIEHELDHLNGITMLERVSPLKSLRAKTKLSKKKRAADA